MLYDDELGREEDSNKNYYCFFCSLFGATFNSFDKGMAKTVGAKEIAGGCLTACSVKNLNLDLVIKNYYSIFAFFIII